MPKSKKADPTRNDWKIHDLEAKNRKLKAAISALLVLAPRAEQLRHLDRYYTNPLITIMVPAAEIVFARQEAGL